MCKTAVAKVRWRPCGALHDLSDGFGRRDHTVGDEAGKTGKSERDSQFVARRLSQLRTGSLELRDRGL